MAFPYSFPWPGASTSVVVPAGNDSIPELNTGSGRDLLLNLQGDLLLDEGDLVLSRGGVAVVQDAVARLRFNIGEWFLDEDFGLPLYTEILVKNPNLAAIRSAFRNALLACPGIAEVVSLELDFDRAHRSLSVSFRATTDLGELISARTEI